MDRRTDKTERAAPTRIWPYAAVGAGLWLAIAGGAFALARWLTG